MFPSSCAGRPPAAAPGPVPSHLTTGDCTTGPVRPHFRAPSAGTGTHGRRGRPQTPLDSRRRRFQLAPALPTWFAPPSLVRHDGWRSTSEPELRPHLLRSVEDLPCRLNRGRLSFLSGRRRLAVRIGVTSVLRARLPLGASHLIARPLFRLGDAAAPAVTVRSEWSLRLARHHDELWRPPASRRISRPPRRTPPGHRPAAGDRFRWWSQSGSGPRPHRAEADPRPSPPARPALPTAANLDRRWRLPALCAATTQLTTSSSV